jgi:adenylate cyclase
MFALRGNLDGVEIAYDLRAEKTLVGRAITCDFVLARTSVSRQHAQFRVHDGRCFVQDLGSLSGTFVNGQRVSAETEIVPGDRLKLGVVALRLDYASDRGIRLHEESGESAPGLTIVHQITDLSGTFTRPAVTADRLLALLSEIGRTLTSMQPLPQVLARVLGLTFDVLPNERAFLMLRDPQAPEEMRATVGLRRDGSVPEQIAISRTLLRHVVQNQAAVVIDNVGADRRFETSESLLDLEKRSVICGPLWNRSDVIGVLFIDAPGPDKFSRADLELFTALASYAAVAIDQARLSEHLVQEARRRERLQRYHSPAIVQRIMKAGDDAESQLFAEEVDVTVLFCDIASFTTVCERLSPHDIMSLLNGFLSRMSDVIFQFDGTLDKFIGDELMVVFNSPFRQPDHALRAARTALGMRKALAVFNQELPIIPLEMRIAIASGPSMVGDVGTPQRRDFTVLGDAVNTAARLKSAVANPGEIVLSHGTWEQLDGQLPTVLIGPVELRGRSKQVEVYRLLEPS